MPPRVPSGRTSAGSSQSPSPRPTDPAAVDALIWIVQFGFDGPEFDRAIDLLAEPRRERKVGHAAAGLVYKLSPTAERLLRAVIEKNPDRPSGGCACLGLGRYLKNQSERVRSIQEDPEAARRWEAMFLEQGADKEGFARFSEQGPGRPDEGGRGGVRTDRQGVRRPARRPRLRPWARRPGPSSTRSATCSPASRRRRSPATDVDGQPFKLSDYRGKVVLLSSGPTGAGRCRDKIPHERSLVERMQGRPFVLLGVNGDGDKDQLRELMKKEGITWRSWWDGGGSANTPGPIARQFNVHAWPTLYLLDHRGIIRHKFLGTPGPGSWTPRSTRLSRPRSETPPRRALAVGTRHPTSLRTGMRSQRRVPFDAASRPLQWSFRDGARRAPDRSATAPRPVIGGNPS